MPHMLIRIMEGITQSLFISQEGPWTWNSLHKRKLTMPKSELRIHIHSRETATPEITDGR